MRKNKSSVSRASSYAEIGEFCNQHDGSEYWGKTRNVKFDVDIESEVTYYPTERNLAERIQFAARDRGVSFDWSISGWSRRLKSRRPKVSVLPTDRRSRLACGSCLTSNRSIKKNADLLESQSCNRLKAIVRVIRHSRSFTNTRE